MTLGAVLRKARVDKEVGLRQMADLIGCSVAYLSRLETDTIDCVPSEELLVPTDVEQFLLDNPKVLKRLRREMNRKGDGR